MKKKFVVVVCILMSIHTNAAVAASDRIQMGIDLLLYDGNYDASRQNSKIEEMIHDKLDGILMSPQDSGECAEGGAELASKAGIPVVSVNTRVESEAHQRKIYQS